jgi:ribose transport system substrate-binding protein
MPGSGPSNRETASAMVLRWSASDFRIQWQPTVQFRLQIQQAPRLSLPDKPSNRAARETKCFQSAATQISWKGCFTRRSDTDTDTPMKINRLSKLFLALLFSTGLLLPAFAADKQLKSVGLTVGDLGNPFFVQVAHGVESKTKEINPGAKVTTLSSNYDVKNQTKQIDNFVGSHVDLIIVGAADSKRIAPAIKRAKAAGVVVVAVDVGAEGGVDATVMSDNRQAGEEAAQYIVERLKGKGQIVIVNGPPVTSVEERVKGALETFKKAPNIKILSKDQNAQASRDGGFKVMSDLLTSFPNVDAVFAVNDPTGIGCDAALRQKGHKGAFVVGVDGSPDASKALKDEKSSFAATPAQDPYAMAQKAVEVGFDIMNGKKPKESTILIPVKLISRDNVDQYPGWTK